MKEINIPGGKVIVSKEELESVKAQAALAPKPQVKKTEKEKADQIDHSRNMIRKGRRLVPASDEKRFKVGKDAETED